jgi:acyl-CoA reductase-like NAD-dependent aldehyde dehydrogenase
MKWEPNGHNWEAIQNGNAICSNYILMKSWVNGHWVKRLGQAVALPDPSGFRPPQKIYQASLTDLDLAVDSAKKALKTPLSLSSRASVLRSIASTLQSHQKKLAKTETLSGKIYSQAMADVEYAAQVFTYFAGHCDHFVGIWVSY